MRRLWDRLGLVGVTPAAVVFVVASMHANSTEDAVHDVSTLRSLRASYGVFHRVDLIVASITKIFPHHSVVHVASIATAVTIALATYLVAAQLRLALRALAPGSRWASPIAIVGTLAGGLSLPWQLESSVPGGEAIGAMLGLLPVILLAGADTKSRPRDRLAGLLFGLAWSEDPRLALAATVSLVATALLHPGPERGPSFDVRDVARGALLGLAPLALHLVLTRPDLHTLGEGFGETTAVPFKALLEALRDDAGDLVLVLALAGLFVARRAGKSGRLATALLLLGLGGGVITALEGATAPLARGPGSLVFVLSVSLLATFALFDVIRRVAASKAPLSGVTTAMIFLLEATIVVTRAETGLDACQARAVEQLPRIATWDHELFGGLPEDSLILVSSHRLFLHLEAARVAGALVPRTLLPSFARPEGVTAEALLANAPERALLRDLELGASPTEGALSALADTRPLFVELDPRWDHTLTRHLTFEHALAAYTASPRGATERRDALLAWGAHWAELQSAAVKAPAILPVAGAVLRARAVAFAMAADHPGLDETLQEMASLAPRDPFVREMTRRAASMHGAVDVRNLPAIP